MELQPTPLEEYPALAKTVGVGTLSIKREDLNPSGSHKDRGLWPYLDQLTLKGEREFCLSSSGNLAISAAWYAAKHPEISFHLFLPQSLSHEKRVRLNHVTIQPCSNVQVYWSKTPKTDAVRFSREKGIHLFRGSSDDGMLQGYHQLAQELIEQTKGGIGSVFTAVSSGTMAVGLWQGFIKQLPTSNFQLPQLHIVQTAKVHPIASQFDHDFTPSKSSIASAIVDRVAHRKSQVILAIKESGGWGWVVSDKEITNANSLIERRIGFENVSSENAMSLAGLQKTMRQGFVVHAPIVLMFTGK